MRSNVLSSIALAILVLGSAGVSEAQYQYDQYGRSRDTRYQRTSRYNRGYRNAVTVPAGTPMVVRLDTQISTDDDPTGATWNGTMVQSVYVNGRVAIPAGSSVQGVVTQATQGTHNTQAQMSLAVQSVSMNGQTREVNANTESIVADSKRAKKLGAIALGAAAGALLGHTVAEHHHGTLIGGLLGGAAGYGATRHAFRTLVLKPGTELSFTTTEDMVAYR